MKAAFSFPIEGALGETMYDAKRRTDFLFAVPSFLSGVASILDLFGTFKSYNGSKSPTEADMKAIASDWAVVGADLEANFPQAEYKAAKRCDNSR